MQPRLNHHRQSNPLAQLVTAVVAAIGLGVALFLGAFVLAAIVGLGAIAAAGLYLRFWWLRRQLRNGAGGAEQHREYYYRRRQDADGTVIEGDFRDLGDREPRSAWERADRR